MSKKVQESRFIDMTPIPMFNNVPATDECFLGRNKEMFELIDLIHHNKLVTVKGMIGVGKTSLVKEVASKLIDRYMFA